jgi:flagellar protein FliS
MDGIALYKENAVTMASKSGLVVKLYEGAIKFLNLAIDAAQGGKWDKKGEYIGRAMAIIEELDRSLDMRVGGEIASNLHKLYLFMNKRLANACMSDDNAMIRDVISLLNELNQGWKAIHG